MKQWLDKAGCFKEKLERIIKSKEILLPICCFLLGIVIGFLISPIKKGIEIGNNAGNTTTNNMGDSKVEKKASQNR